jgi:prepilin-type N-terminal cleavage/methylation domain-containing protein
MKLDRRQSERGFTLIELLMATAIFLLICGAMFGLLQLSQQKYSSESQMSGTFQETRLAMDQIVRDVNESGYPPLSFFSQVPTDPSSYALTHVAWAGYGPNSSCQIGTAGVGTCVVSAPTGTSPGDYDLIVETAIGDNTNTGNKVFWIRYQLIATTLYRGVVQKTAGADPATATSATGVMTPFLNNVVNNPSDAQLSAITADFPSMFPAGAPVPVFQYMCDTPAGPQACPNAGVDSSPPYIRDVDVTLIVAAPQLDAQTHRWKLVELNGRGHRMNPSSLEVGIGN